MLDAYRVDVDACHAPQTVICGYFYQDPVELVTPLLIYCTVCASVRMLTVFLSLTVYTNPENGQMVYAAGPSGASTSTAAAPHPIPVPRGKKRKAGGSGAAAKEPKVMTDSVEDVPCTPDDDDINTPYPCEHCNRSIKGRVMLQAHHYQEHYDNPALNGMDIGDKHVCRVCLKLFTRNSDVKAHILRVHCGDR